MEKSFATDDHAALIDAAGGRAFTFFGKQPTATHITKSASEVISRQDVQDHMPPDNQFGVHLITMGAEEAFGPNRNGDSASIKSLTDHHGSFEKYGHVFREHRNRDPKTQGIGTVRLARYNPKMNRGELLAWVEKDKAPDMYKKAQADEELSWSMSMRLPHDECSCCHKKSRVVSDYCNHLKNDMLQWVPGFEKFAYAKNEEGVKFFDISEVERRADRIGTYLGYSFSGDTLAKAASADQVISGAAWADHHFGSNRPVPFTAWEEGTLEKLAQAAQFVAHADENVRSTLATMGPADLSQDQIDTLARPDFRSVGGELAKEAMIINFPTFASMVLNIPIADLEKQANYSETVADKLPSILEDMTRMGGSCCGEDVASSVAPDEIGCSFDAEKDSIDRLMKETGGSLGMTPEDSKGRAMTVTVIKKASAPSNAEVVIDPYFEALVHAYGHYVVKAAHLIKSLPEVSEHNLFRSVAASMMIR